MQLWLGASVSTSSSWNNDFDSSYTNGFLWSIPVQFFPEWLRDYAGSIVITDDFRNRVNWQH